MKRALLALTIVLACSFGCSGTPIGEGDPGEPPPVSLDARSLTPEQAAQAATQLASSLRLLDGGRSRVLAELASLTGDEGEDSLDVVMRELIAREFEVARLAELLHLACARQPGERAPLLAASAALRALAISAMLELLAVLDIEADLGLGYLSAHRARILLEDRFDALREPTDADEVALLPDQLSGQPLLSLARSYSGLVEIGETPASFEDAIVALEAQTAVDIGNAAEIDAPTLRLAVMTRLSLLSGASANPPDSVFGTGALTLPVSASLLYTVRGHETVGQLADGRIPPVTLTVNDGKLTVNLLQSGVDDQSPSLRASAAVDDGLDRMPSISRPVARLVERGSGYGFEVVLSFVNPSHTPFRVTCILPELGARATTAAIGRSSSGELTARAGITISPLGLQSLALEPQVVCLATYGTVETGRLGLPPGLLPELPEAD